jgi:hypothetical protein
MIIIERFERSSTPRYQPSPGFLLHCMNPELAQSVALNPPCWGLLIEVKRTAMWNKRA